MTLPTSNTPSQREILTSPVSVSTRTPQNCAPRAAFNQRWSRRYLDGNLACPASLPRRVPEPTVASMDGSPAAAKVVAWLSPTVLVRRASVRSFCFSSSQERRECHRHVGRVGGDASRSSDGASRGSGTFSTRLRMASLRGRHAPNPRRRQSRT
jgi:hypothetical protein